MKYLNIRKSYQTKRKSERYKFFGIDEKFAKTWRTRNINPLNRYIKTISDDLLTAEIIGACAYITSRYKGSMEWNI